MTRLKTTVHTPVLSEGTRINDLEKGSPSDNSASGKRTELLGNDPLLVSVAADHLNPHFLSNIGYS